MLVGGGLDNGGHDEQEEERFAVAYPFGLQGREVDLFEAPRQVGRGRLPERQSR
jgi:hypothetical protein